MKGTGPRLIRLKDRTIRVEGKQGVVLIDQEDGQMLIRCIPDTLCEAIDQIGNAIQHDTILRRREDEEPRPQEDPQ
jgi:hypothetical protein